MQQRKQGFTLLEILVVLFIIGITLTFAVLSVDDRAAEDRLQREAERLEALLDLAADEAILYGVEIGLQLTPKGYRFLRLDQGGWQLITDTGTPLRPRELEAGHDLRLLQQDDADRQQLAANTDGGEGNGDGGPRPDVLFLSSGEITPFELQLRSENTQVSYLFNGQLTGELTVKREESETL